MVRAGQEGMLGWRATLREVVGLEQVEELEVEGVTRRLRAFAWWV